MSWQEAVETGNLSQIKELIDRGVDVNTRLSQNQTALAIATTRGRKDIVRVLVRAGASPNLRDDLGDIPLMKASKVGNESIFEYLNILTEQNYRKPALEELYRHILSPSDRAQQVEDFIAAAAEGKLEEMKNLLASGVEIDALGKVFPHNGKTALYMAARNDRREVLKALIAAGSDLNMTAKEDDPFSGEGRDCPQCQTHFIADRDRARCPNCGCLFYASLPEYDENAKSPRLLDRAIVDESTPGIRTTTVSPKAIQEHQQPIKPPQPWREHSPLMTAVRRGHREIVGLLVEAGANLRSASWYGNSPLYLAVESGRQAIAQILIDAGVNLDVFEGIADEAKTPLMVAVEKSDLEMLEMLLNSGADVNAKEGRFGNSALVLAARIGNKTIIKRLQEAGAVQEGLDAIALVEAAEKGDLKQVKMLLAAGVDPNCPEPLHNFYPLVQAACKGHLEVVRVLIEAGSNIDSKSYFTPLLAATYYGHTEIVRLLIEAGADVNLSVSIWGTALEQASSHQYTDIVDLLTAAGAVLPDDDEEFPIEF